MSIERNSINPWVDRYPYYCTLSQVDDSVWAWLSSNVIDGQWAWDLVYDRSTSDICSDIWIGFKQRDDYFRFLLTWV